jgi:hypothetical protein
MIKRTFLSLSAIITLAILVAPPPVEAASAAQTCQTRVKSANAANAYFTTASDDYFTEPTDYSHYPVKGKPGQTYHQATSTVKTGKSNRVNYQLVYDRFDGYQSYIVSFKDAQGKPYADSADTLSALSNFRATLSAARSAATTEAAHFSNGHHSQEGGYTIPLDVSKCATRAGQTAAHNAIAQRTKSLSTVSGKIKDVRTSSGAVRTKLLGEQADMTAKRTAAKKTKQDNVTLQFSFDATSVKAGQQHSYSGELLSNNKPIPEYACGGGVKVNSSSRPSVFTSIGSVKYSGGHCKINGKTQWASSQAGKTYTYHLVFGGNKYADKADSNNVAVHVSK